MKVIKNRVLFLIFLLFFSFSVVLTGVCPTKYVRADNLSSKFDETNVLDDLKDMTLDGEKFSLEEYNFDSKKETQILSFVEFCYSFYEAKQNDFGFYVYIYNPKGLKFNTDSSLNTIQFATTKDSDSAYTKYTLTYLNKSEKADYEGLFYKFKVNLTEEQKTAILNGVNSSSRVYKVSGFELVTQGNLNATDYAVSLMYKYSGYAKGCGPNENAESTLKFTSEGLETIEDLKVFPTTYRPDGTNGKNDYTQDSLHSVYFAVPNEVIEQYGEMVAVHATWLNAVLKPALVTGNQELLVAIRDNLGKDSFSADIPYRLYGNYIVANEKHRYSYGYNIPSDDDHVAYEGAYGNVNPLYLLFDSGLTDNSADDYMVSSEIIQEKLIESADKFGGDLVNGKYSEYMFESVDANFTEVNLRADETFSLDSELEVLGSSFWDRLFGKTHTISSKFDGIQAIYPVKDKDLSGTNEQISDKLYISEYDVDDFKSYYNVNKENSTVYLFRYQVSDYVSREVSVQKRVDDFFGLYYWENDGSNAYFFQETVNLDFDVIDLTFSTGEVETVIPVVSSPIDVIPDATPPVYTENDNDGPALLKIILGLILLIILLVIFWPILPSVIRFIINIVLFPFKMINKLFKKNKSG